MCVIALSPRDVRVDKSTLEDMWDCNNDGGGISFIDETNTLRTYKSMDKNDFIEIALRTIDKYYRTSPILIHCRIATHGSVCIENNHPFHVDNHTVMAHNGIIDCVEVPENSNLSDTRMFINTWLRYLRPTWLDDVSMREYVGEIIGWSKLAFITTNQNLRESYYIINEDEGTWIDGTWFSNTNHCAVPGSVINYQTGNYHYYDMYDGNDLGYVSVGDHVHSHVRELSDYSSIGTKEFKSLSYDDFCELYVGEFGDNPDISHTQWNSYCKK